MLHFVFLWHIVFCWILLCWDWLQVYSVWAWRKKYKLHKWWCINDDVKDKVVKYGIPRSWMLALLLIKETFGVISNHLKFKIHQRGSSDIFTLHSKPPKYSHYVKCQHHNLSISNYIKPLIILRLNSDFALWNRISTNSAQCPKFHFFLFLWLISTSVLGFAGVCTSSAWCPKCHFFLIFLDIWIFGWYLLLL